MKHPRFRRFRSTKGLLDWQDMRRLGLLSLNVILSIIPASLFAGAAVEGRVELPKSHAAPVQAKRYEIVTKAGVLSTAATVGGRISRWQFPADQLRCQRKRLRKKI